MSANRWLSPKSKTSMKTLTDYIATHIKLSQKVDVKRNTKRTMPAKI